jgi:hypothetical protein
MDLSSFIPYLCITTSRYGASREDGGSVNFVFFC